MQTIPQQETKIPQIETKSLSNAQEVGQAFGDFMHAFESFKQANDERLQQIEKQVGSDILTVEKVERLNRVVDEQKHALDQYVLKQARPVLSAGLPQNGAAYGNEHKQAFDLYIRRGEEQGLRGIESKAHSYGSGPDGGYLVPAEVETAIASRLAALSPVRALATVRQVSGAVLKKPFSISGPAPAGSANRMHGRRPIMPNLLSCNFRLWKFMPCQRPPRHCWMMRR